MDIKRGTGFWGGLARWAGAWQLPQSCFLCGALSPAAVCPACTADLPLHRPGCARCACSLPTGQTLCGTCLLKPPRFFQAQAVLRYDVPANRLIIAAKFSENLAVLRFLGDLMAERLDFKPVPPDVLVPVPLHPSGLRQRGYNQAAELAKRVGRRHRIPCALAACACIKHKRPQLGLSYIERRHNVRGAFAILHREPTWRHVGLVDDVLTTGATADELAKGWLRAGAERVSVWCCARRDRL